MLYPTPVLVPLLSIHILFLHIKYTSVSMNTICYSVSNV